MLVAYPRSGQSEALTTTTTDIQPRGNSVPPSPLSAQAEMGPAFAGGRDAADVPLCVPLPGPRLRFQIGPSDQRTRESCDPLSLPDHHHQLHPPHHRNNTMIRNTLRTATTAGASSSRMALSSAARPALVATPRVATSSPFSTSQARGYHEKVIDHYENPRNVGSFLKSDKNIGIGLVGAPACGDVMKLSIKVGESGIIEDVRFKTFGCGSAIASSSLATEKLKGLTLEEAGRINNTEIAKELSLPPVKVSKESAKTVCEYHYSRTHFYHLPLSLTRSLRSPSRSCTALCWPRTQSRPPSATTRLDGRAAARRAQGTSMSASRLAQARPRPLHMCQAAPD